MSLLAPIYSILSLLQICFPTAAVYIIPWLDVAQANCLASYFLLLCELISPEAEGRDLFFSTIDIKGKKKGKGNGGRNDGVKWFQVRLTILRKEFGSSRFDTIAGPGDPRTHGS